MKDSAPPNNEAAVHLKLKQCVQLLPDYALALRRTLRYAQAKASCDIALARDPDNVKAYVRRAQANVGLQEDGRAVKGAFVAGLAVVHSR